MKKIFLTTAMVAAVLSVSAQDQDQVLTTKKGTPILPTAGSIAMGIDATPIFRYVGNMFSDYDAGAPLFGNYGLFFGKYFLKDKTALRFGATVAHNFNSTTNYVPKVGGTVDEQVEDVIKQTNSAVVLFGGLEKRIGKTRLQGFYGGEFLLGFNSEKTKYVYGNSLSAANPNSGYERPLKYKSGAGFGVGARAFAGVEYFITPGIAIGGEIGWVIGYNFDGAGENEMERWTGTKVETRTTKVAKRSGFSFANDNEMFGGFGTFSGFGTIKLTFYF